MKKLELSTSSVFEEASRQFNESSLSSRLEEKYRIKPYFEKYAHFKTVALVSSFFLNLFSAATASYFVFDFTKSLVNYTWAAIITTICFLLLLESFKRLITPYIFKDLLQFGFSLKLVPLSIFVVLAASSSVALSYYGAKEAVHELKSPVAQIQIDSISNYYAAQIDVLEKKQKEVKSSQSWKGNLTKQGQKTYQKIEDQVQLLREESIKAIKKAQDQNQLNKNEHNKTVKNEGKVFAYVTFCLEILFICCIYYIELYDYKSYKQFASFDSSYKKGETPSNLVATEDNDHLLLAIKKAKSNISAYKAKLAKGEGKTSTNEKGLQRWVEKLETLQNRIAL